MPRTSEDLLKEVTRSGYPLQAAISRLVETHAELLARWSVRYTEHQWRKPGSDEDEFIDLVLTQQEGYGVGELVVEAKRVQESDWTFLRPLTETDTTRAKGFVVLRQHGQTGKREAYGWCDLELRRSSPESAFCVIVGDSSKDRPLLERLAATTIASTEALASEDSRFPFTYAESNPMRVYFSAIVTTARPHLCNYDPAALDLTTGTLADADIQDLPYVRFRKQVAGAISPMKSPGLARPEKVAEAKESTVFVVNIDHLASFLHHFDVDDARLRDILGTRE